MASSDSGQTDRGGKGYEKLAKKVWDKAAGPAPRAPVKGQPGDPAAEAAVAKAQLDGIRKRAEGWRSGVAGTFTLILASLAIKPGEGFMKYEGTTQTVLACLLGSSIAISLIGLLLLVRSANGPSWLEELSGEDASEARYLRRARGAYLDFVLGRFAWALALVLFVIAVGVTWVVEPPA